MPNKYAPDEIPIHMIYPDEKFLQEKSIFPRQSLKISTFSVKLSDSIFFLLGHSPIVKLILRKK